jgi:hypothetical protein
VLANTEKIMVTSEKFYGGVGLRRCNRSTGFSANFRRHKERARKLHLSPGTGFQNLEFLPGCRTGACCQPKLQQFRPWKSAGSGGKERGEGGGSIPCLTRSGDAL